MSADPKDYNRSGTFQTVSAMPCNFDIVLAGDTVTGHYTAIKMYNVTDLPNDTTSILVENELGQVEGKNLSSFNNVWVDGDILHGHFTKIASPHTGHSMRIIAYKAG